MTRPLQGVRVLSMEQAAALPFATRHLADLGAEVIRVQSHRRPLGVLQEPGLYRNKRLVGLDLTRPRGPELFRRLAGQCDVVAHNYTPRVMRKFGLDFETLGESRSDLVYCDVTGFGTSGAWSDRPLFGPGAEAVSGHNLLIGEPGDPTPGRPGTITYADNVCGLNVLFAVLGALDRRDSAPGSQHIDLSLYETAVAQLGPTLAARQLGDQAKVPTRVGNEDAAWAHQGFVEVTDGALAVSVAADQLDDFNALDLSSFGVASALALLHARGIAAARLEDIADVVGNQRRWRRGYFMAGRDQPWFGPVWGCGDTPAPHVSKAIGADNREVFGELTELSEIELDELHADGTLGVQAVDFGVAPSADPDRDIDRGLLARVDLDPGAWRRCSDSVAGSAADSVPASAEPETGKRRLLELSGSVGVAQVGSLFRESGWDVVCVEPEGGNPERRRAARWGAAAGATFSCLNRGKRSVTASAAEVVALAAAADVVIGDLSEAGLAVFGVTDADLSPRRVLASVTAFGRGYAAPASDFTLQAASGFLALTGEFHQQPQQLPPEAAHLVAGVGLASAVLAAWLSARRDGLQQHLDLALVDVLTGFSHLQAFRYVATGEVPGREGRVKHALRMAPARDGFVYCAPGAVMSADMCGVAELLDEPRLTDERFQSAEGRMTHWDEYVELMRGRLAERTAQQWCDAAARLRLTFALVQSVDDLLNCPQLAVRGALRTIETADGKRFRVPVVRFPGGADVPSTPGAEGAEAKVPVCDEHGEAVGAEWLASGERQ